MRNRKFLWTTIALVSAAAALSGVVDGAAEGYADSAFKRALVTFAVARTLNGVISVAQGTELALQPGGIGVNLSAGQILDPVNDLVEQFSDVMLLAASSLGLQNVLLDITAWSGITATLLVAAGLIIATLWWPRLSDDKYFVLASRIFMAVLCVRFIVPLLIISTNLISNAFLEGEQTEATAALEATRIEIEELNKETEMPPEPDRSIVDRIGSFIDDSLQSMNVRNRLGRLQQSALDASENIVNLIALFVLQTIILPLAVLWLLVEILKGIAARTTRL